MVQHYKKYYIYLSPSFQYILCCGSTRYNLNFLEQRIKFQYILCCGSTALHGVRQIQGYGFQYILCCGSTFFHKKSLQKLNYFNTSYVVVQHCLIQVLFSPNQNFNTSYVVVQPQLSLYKSIFDKISIHLMLWFNLNIFYFYLPSYTISIHLMLWFNIFACSSETVKIYFNTSYVVVQQVLQFLQEL